MADKQVLPVIRRVPVLAHLMRSGGLSIRMVNGQVWCRSNWRLSSSPSHPPRFPTCRSLKNHRAASTIDLALARNFSLKVDKTLTIGCSSRSLRSSVVRDESQPPTRECQPRSTGRHQTAAIRQFLLLWNGKPAEAPSRASRLVRHCEDKPSRLEHPPSAPVPQVNAFACNANVPHSRYGAILWTTMMPMSIRRFSN